MNPDPGAVEKLTFQQEHGQSYSFDIGGLMRGGKFNGHMFLAEVKNYTNDNGQGPMYEEFLAKCYRAHAQSAGLWDHFMFITWAPFKAQSWSKLATPDELEKAVRKHWKYNFTAEDASKKAKLPDSILSTVSEKLWVIVLSDKQVEHLSMDQEHLAVLNAHITREGN